MTKFVRWEADEVPESTTTVCILVRDADAIMTWVEDEDRPGEVLVLAHGRTMRYRPVKNEWACFVFSDKNVAFEFKMVWG